MSYTKRQVGQALRALRIKLPDDKLESLIEWAQDHGYIERAADMGFTVTKRGQEFIAADDQAKAHRRQLAKQAADRKRRLLAKELKRMQMPELTAHERRFSHLFYQTWNAIGPDIRDCSADELAEMSPDVVAEIILDAQHIETFCDDPKDAELIKELRALPYEEQLRLATGENFGF